MANPEYQPVSDAEGQRWVDFALFTGLLLLAAIPLVSLGKALWTTSGPLLPVTGLIGLGIALAWLRRNRQPARTADARLPTRRRKFGYGLGSPVLLTLFAVLAFYQPMKRAFWNSTDEAEMLYTVNRRPLSEALTFSDGWEARPLEMFGVALAQTFSPEALDGFVWIAFLFHSATAVFLYGIVHELFHARELALVGTLLYLVNPSEPWRYIAIVMMDYHLSLCLLLASIWLYLHSYRYRLRWMLLAACAALVGVFLTRESALFLAMAVPLLLVVTSKPSFGLAVRKRPELVLWLYAWIGTLALMVLRFVLFWATTPDTYQKHLAAIQPLSPAQVLSNLAYQLTPIFSYFQNPMAVAPYWPYATATALAAGALLWLNTRQAPSRPITRQALPSLALIGIGILLGIAPYFSFSDIRRTQFFVAPLQSVGWALVIALVGSWLGRRQWIGTIVLTASMALVAMAGSLQFQASQGQIDSPLDKTIYIFDQIHRYAPHIQPDTLILLDLINGTSPFGARNYQLLALSRLALGVDAYPANVVDEFGQHAVFTSDGITLSDEPSKAAQNVRLYPFERVIAFRVMANGQVIFLDDFPITLLPGGVSAAGYAPQNRILAGDYSPLPFLHYPLWMPPYQPSPDIVTAESGLILGDGWFDFETNEHRVWRWVKQDAEVIATGGKSASEPITIDLQPGPGVGDKALDLQILDASGRVIAFFKVTHRETITFDLPMSAGHATTFRLHTISPGLPTPNGDPRILNAQVYRING